VVELDKGEHQITSNWIDQHGDNRLTTLGITRSNITFLGKGKDKTTILGGFAIRDLQNITFKEMTVTNTSEEGCGINMSNAKVELFDVALNGCDWFALYMPSPTSETIVVATRCEFAKSNVGAVIRGGLTSAKFNNCVFHDNSNDGILGWESTIHLHGEATAIHSNKDEGICAIHHCKVLIHLPSHHNTFYNNTGEDRKTYTYDTATITNVED